MESMNHKESNPLRDLGLMTAYLRDETDEKRIQEIEAEMDQDPLYQLAMEALAQSLIEDPAGTPERMMQTEEAFPELLLNAKHQFIRQLEAESKPGNDMPPPSGGWLSNLPGWQKWLGGIGILLLVGSLAMMPFLINGPDMQKKAMKQLAVDGDLLTGENFLKECEQNPMNPGIGSGKRVSIYSALVESYAQEKYTEAARQFQTLEQYANLSDNCLTFTRFYLAKSLMMEGKLTEAAAAFQLVTEKKATQTALAHAAHWFLGNLALVEEDGETAAFHFQILADSHPSARNEHLETLLTQQYIKKAKSFLKQLDM